jgi:hypothetical protein
LDLDENGKFDGNDFEVPFSVQNGTLNLNATWLANRASSLVRPSNYGVFDLHNNGIDIVPTAFSLVFDRPLGLSNIGISKVTALNPLTNKRLTLVKEVKTAAAPNRFNRPVISRPAPPFEVWRGVIKIDDIKVINHPVRIEMGTVIELAAGASLIFKSKLNVEGRKDNPVKVVPRGPEPWGTFALMGEGSSGSALKHLHLRGGSGVRYNGVKFMAMFSVHSAADIQVTGLQLSDNKVEDDMMHIVYGDRIRLKDINFKNARSDALDIDISNVSISGGVINRAENDCLDFMTSKVTIDSLILSNCGDKGVSVGEASQAVIFNSVIQNSNIGIESKDGSDVLVLHSDFLDNKMQANAYKKNWRYSDGGQIKLSKSFLTASKEGLKADKNSEIMIDDTSILGSVKTGRQIKISGDVEFFDNRIAKSNTAENQLFYQIPLDLLAKVQGHRGAVPR